MYQFEAAENAYREEISVRENALRAQQDELAGQRAILTPEAFAAREAWERSMWPSGQGANIAFAIARLVIPVDHTFRYRLAAEKLIILVLACFVV